MGAMSPPLDRRHWKQVNSWDVRDFGAGDEVERSFIWQSGLGVEHVDDSTRRDVVTQTRHWVQIGETRRTFHAVQQTCKARIPLYRLCGKGLPLNLQAHIPFASICRSVVRQEKVPNKSGVGWESRGPEVAKCWEAAANCRQKDYMSAQKLNLVAKFP